MSYLEPSSWTDVDSAGVPLSWTSREGKLLYPAYEMLRLALVERCAVADVSVPAILQTPRAPGSFPYDGWFGSFDSTIGTLIPLFVNHTDNSGNWQGVATIPQWAESSILSDVGDVSLYTTSIPKSAWSKQKYEILNRLLWTKNNCTSSAWVDGPARREVTTTVANYISDWNASAWGDLDDKWMTGVGAGVYSSGKNPSSMVIVNKQRGLCKYTHAYIYSATIDIYQRFSYPQYVRPTVFYEDCDYGTSSQGEYASLDSGLTVDFSDTLSIEVANTDNISNPSFVSASNQWYGYRADSLQGGDTFATAITKYNVPGGFNFQP